MKKLITLCLLGTWAVVLAGCTLVKQPDTTTTIGTMQTGTTQIETEKTSNPTTMTVTVSNFSFGPKEITVKVGDTVTWKNEDNVDHTATADNGSFDGDLPSDGEFSYTFSTPGTYSYYCKPHPHMKGTVIVQ